MKTVLTIGGFIAAAVLACMALVLVGALNLVLNGYHSECGIWENAVPFACNPGKKPEGKANVARPAPPAKASLKASAAPQRPAGRLAPQKAAAVSKPSNNPYTGRREPWGCGPLQAEPYRVQCVNGICYHDPGFRANCGLAHDWRDGQ
jgi:hypothetical protein